MCIRDREFNDRFTNLSFALGNKLLGVLDEKQHREREGDKNIGWYHKTDFEISAVFDLSVSYTHLDVYKRQGYQNEKVYAGRKTD